MHGYGEYQFADGTVYTGKSDNDRFHDERGQMKWPDERIYIGEFKYDEITGMGEMNWPNGDEYKG